MGVGSGAGDGGGGGEHPRSEKVRRGRPPKFENKVAQMSFPISGYRLATLPSAGDSSPLKNPWRHPCPQCCGAPACLNCRCLAIFTERDGMPEPKEVCTEPTYAPPCGTEQPKGTERRGLPDQPAPGHARPEQRPSCGPCRLLWAF